MIAFELSMPRNNAWNGRWSGDGDTYAIVKSFRQKPCPNGIELVGHRFTYNFGDGWVAAINVREVDRKEAARLRRVSRGFCGYDWMVDSLLRSERIEAERLAAAAQEAIP